MKNLKLQDSENLQQEGSSLDVNGFCLIQLLSFGNFKVLLTGDAGSTVEDRIARGGGKVDVLKVPHHGSKTGMSDYFLTKINPAIAIISVGVNNKYGHPAKEALGLLKSYDIGFFRTDKDGEIEVVSDGHAFQIVN